MTPAARRVTLGALLLLTLGAAVYPVEEETTIVVATRERTAPSAPAETKTADIAVQLSLAERSVPALKDIRDPFRAALAPAPKIVPVEQPAVAPTAPALPFVFKGRLDDADGATVILATGTDSYLAKRGDVLQQSYRVDEIEDSTITFTYLPMKETQVLKVETLQQ